MSDLQIVNASKTYGTVGVLNQVNLEISSGEFVVFVGPSGCGKSTLLRMISGLEDISSGEIWLDGRVVNDVDPAKRRVRRPRDRFAPHEARARLHVLAVARSECGPWCLELRGSQPVLSNPERERALFQQRRAVGRLRDRTHSRGERHREYGQRNENLD